MINFLIDVLKTIENFFLILSNFNKFFEKLRNISTRPIYREKMAFG